MDILLKDHVLSEEVILQSRRKATWLTFLSYVINQHTRVSGLKSSHFVVLSFSVRFREKK